MSVENTLPEPDRATSHDGPPGGRLKPVHSGSGRVTRFPACGGPRYPYPVVLGAAPGSGEDQSVTASRAYESAHARPLSVNKVAAVRNRTHTGVTSSVATAGMPGTRVGAGGVMVQRRPWVKRKHGEIRLWAWMPFDPANRVWIKDELGARIQPEWNRAHKRWEIARPHMWILAESLADRFGEVEVYLEFSDSDRCDTRCQDANPATVDDCVCSCLGRYHGGRGEPRDWKAAGATTLHTRGGITTRYLLLTSE